MMDLRVTAFSLFLLLGLQLGMADALPADSLVVITGIVKEASHKKGLAGTNISVPGSNIATVSNADNEFWKDYNIIEPTETLEKAVIKLVKARK